MDTRTNRVPDELTIYSSTMSDTPLYQPYRRLGVLGGSKRLALGLISGGDVSTSSRKACASDSLSDVENEGLLIAMLPLGIVDTVTET